MKSLKLLLLLPLLYLGGCATFPGHALPQVTSFPTPSEKPSAAVSLSFRQYVNGQPINIAVKTGEASLQSKMVERFRASGLYSSVSTNNPNADISVSVAMKDEGSGSMGMAFLTGLTLYLVPSSTTDDYVASATVENMRTGQKTVVQAEDFVTMWQQLFLLPLLPFDTLPGVANDVQNNIMDTLAIRVHAAAIKLASSSLVSPSSKTADDTAGGRVLQRLKVLKDAYKSGLISKHDYEAKKADLIRQL